MVLEARGRRLVTPNGRTRLANSTGDTSSWRMALALTLVSLCVKCRAPTIVVVTLIRESREFELCLICSAPGFDYAYTGAFLGEGPKWLQRERRRQNRPDGEVHIDPRDRRLRLK